VDAITLNFLGGFQVSSTGNSVSRIRGDKIRGLLAYLAVEADRPHARATLAALFWPDQPDTLALGNLSQTLARLRAALGPAAAHLHTTRDSILWQSSSAMDVTSFTGLAGSGAAANLEAAAALYRGEFLAGFGLEGCQAFEEWLLLMRERLLQLALNVLERLADLALAAGRHGDAADAARRQIALDPWRETAYRQLMRALAAGGDRAAALAAYERCRQTLLADLGVEPDPATAALDAHLRHEQPAVSVVAMLPSPSSTLPAPLTPLVGREEELALLDQLLRGQARLVTLLGPGGVGKSRLALSATTILRDAFSAGACWVPLVGVSETGDAAAQADGLAGTILAALGVSSGSQRAPSDELREVLRERALLLILDNCEHLPAVGPLVGELLAAAPSLRVLATSRERLGVYGEELLILGGLAVPDERAEEVLHAAAVQLFVARAQLALRDFGEDAATLLGVARLCRVLEGMPLGIELAAHWVGEYTPDEIAVALRNDLAFLQTRDRETPDRHRSLRAVFDYSWRLLPSLEQQALARLSVFAGGFDRAAALAVAETRAATLAALVDKSLLRRLSAGRYSMHELLRQFAAEQLDAADERAAVEARHGTYYLGFVAARGRRLGRDQPREAAAEIQAEIDNVHQAWNWAVAETRTTELAQAAYGWWQFCLLTGRDVESRRLFGLAIARLRSALDGASIDPLSRRQHQRGLSTLLAIHANHLFSNVPYDEMAAEAREAIRLGAASQGLEGETLGHYVLGRAQQELGQQREARVMWERTIQLARTYQPLDPESELLHEAEWLANIWLFGSSLFFEDYGGGRACVVEALRISQSLHKRRAELFSLASLAMIDFYMGDDLSARQRYEQVLLLARALSDPWAEMRVQRELSEVLRVQGAYAQADTVLNTVVTTARELGIVYEEILALAGLVRLHCQLGDMDGAASWRDGLVQRMGERGVTRDCQAEGLRACAVYALYSGDDQQALAHAERAWQLAEQVDLPNFRADSAVILGHARVRMHQLDLAAAAYQQAIAWYIKIGNATMALEPQAGLMELAVAEGDHVRAQILVETMLPALVERPRARVLTPFYAELTCYRVLAVSGDVRAVSLLRRAEQRLRECAEDITDATLRRSFLEHVAAHRAILTLAHTTAAPVGER
jgi:predicted ATPase/DNA-binding SARP family transcriptional activator